MRATSTMVLAASAMAGCSGLLGIEEFSGPPDIDASVDAPADDAAIDAPPDTVLGRSFTRHIVDGSTEDVAIDLSTTSVQALIPDLQQASGYRMVAGTGMTDGTFRIDGIAPNQAFVLKIGTEYFATTAHDIELRREIPERTGVARTTQQTLVQYDISGLQPADVGANGSTSFLYYFSNRAGVETGSGLSPGDTSASGEINWQQEAYEYYVPGVAPGLPDTTLGDDLQVVHWRSTLYGNNVGLPEIRLETLRDYAPFSGVTVRDGQATALVATMAPVPSNRSLMLNMSRSSFDPGYDGASHAPTTTTLVAAPLEIAIYVTRGLTIFDSPQGAWTMRASTLAPTDSMLINVGWGDPFPATWKRVITQRYTRIRELLLPGTTVAFPLRSGMYRAAPYVGTAPPTAPSLVPPSLVRVEGLDAFAGGRVRFDGTAPITISWVGTPSAKLYQVRLYRLYVGGNRTRAATGPTFTTTALSATLPPEMFAGGEHWAFVVGAVSSPADYSAGQLRPNGLPYTIAEVATGAFRLNATCGNGTLDSDEACDTTNESATCDSDCSAPLCGDGLRNALANEACDGVVDTARCDSDCTAVVCGDGHTNTDVEDCDDGNASDDGNGCSAQCLFNNRCGDGIRQVAAEECDTSGMSATCDVDCTLPVCGDGVLNTLAGEQCDLGTENGSSNGCADTCEIIPLP